MATDGQRWLDWIEAAAVGGDQIARAIWWEGGEFHAKFASGAVVGLSPTGRCCTVRDPSDAPAALRSDAFDAATRRYLTGLCTVTDDMQRIATALRLRNAFALRPFVCSTLLPESTPLLRLAQGHVPEALATGALNWAGCTVDGTTASTIDGIASLTLFPHAGMFSVTYPAAVRDPNTDPSCVRYSPDVPVRTDTTPADLASVTYVMHRSVHYLADAAAAAQWSYPLARLQGQDIAALSSLEPFPITPLLLGTDAEPYPELFGCGDAGVGAGGFYSALNLPREWATVALGEGPVPPSRRGNCYAFERGGGMVVNAAACSAWVLHDRSTLVKGDAGFSHNGRPCFVGDRTVRLAAPSPLSGARHYHLREAMQYLDGTLPPPSSQAVAPRTAPSAAPHRYTIDGVGEATVLGKRYSMRFADRCILRMQDGDPNATVLLPTGETVDVRLDSYAIPDDVQRYCETALAVFERLPLMHP